MHIFMYLKDDTNLKDKITHPYFIQVDHIIIF